MSVSHSNDGHLPTKKAIYVFKNMSNAFCAGCCEDCPCSFPGQRSSKWKKSLSRLVLSKQLSHASRASIGIQFLRQTLLSTIKALKLQIGRDSQPHILDMDSSPSVRSKLIKPSSITSLIIFLNAAYSNRSCHARSARQTDLQAVSFVGQPMFDKFNDLKTEVT